jgi:macrolide-specific efflux system membrane fusion protein
MNKKLWIGIIAATAVIIFGGIKITQKIRSNKISYRKVRVISGPIQFAITSSGSVSPLNRLEIKPPVAGRIEEILTDQGQYVHRGAILAWMSSTDRAALLDAARANSEKELAEWQGIYKPTPVLAPLSGLVIANNIVRGQTVTTQDILMVLSDILVVKGQVDETDLSHIKTGERANIVLDAFPGETVPAKVAKIAYEAKTVNNVTVYEVEVMPLKTDANMRSGMSATISFIVDSRKKALLLPVEAVMTENGQSFVLKSSNEEKSKPQKTEIKTGLSNSKEVEIMEGLEEGDTVVIVEKSRKIPDQSGSSNPFNPMGGGPPKR